MKEKLKYIFTTVVVIIFFGSCSEKSAFKNGYSSAEEKNALFDIFSPATNKESIKLNPKEFVQWCESSDSQLKQTHEMGDFLFTAFYQPTNYLTLREIRNFDSIKEKLFDEKLKEYGDLTYFSYRIENTKQKEELMKINLSTEGEYFARLEYFSFKMQSDFKLLQGRDTLNCLMYHFERVYGLAPYATFVLGFPNVKMNEGFKVVFDDKTFKNGTIITNFDKEIINNIPKVEL